MRAITLLTMLGCREMPRPPALPPGEPADELTLTCPPSQSDAVCACLRSPNAGCLPELLGELRARPAPDAALRYFVRQRLVALLVQQLGRDVDTSLKEFFPHYPPSYFPLAHQGIAPLTRSGCATTPELVLLFPGVVRVFHEFAHQIAALEKQFPGAIFKVVETDPFSEPSVIAAAAASLIPDGEMPIHLVGYSQGAQGALWLLANSPPLARRTKSVLLLSPATWGTELADLLTGSLALLSLEGASCAALGHSAAVALCRKVVGYTFSAAVRHVLEEAARPLGVAVQIPEGTTAARYFLARVRGLESLTTTWAADFWRQQGAHLPRWATWLVFRSDITDSRDLPLSNWFFYQWLKRVDPAYPENDMQVRLANQRLGPPLEDLQILGPVAEGNHWQWELVPDDVPEAAMPKEMLARMPQAALFLALFETLNELGRFCPP
jgi:pimeloyl-ACP methyl ester carboxylesterase